jgi:hypothetical protein
MEKDAVITWHKIKTSWLKARIAYHRRQADSYGTAPVIRSFKRDGYAIWMRNMSMRHAMKAHDLQRRLLLCAPVAPKGFTASLEGRNL